MYLQQKDDKKYHFIIKLTLYVTIILLALCITVYILLFIKFHIINKTNKQTTHHDLICNLESTQIPAKWHTWLVSA